MRKTRVIRELFIATIGVCLTLLAVPCALADSSPMDRRDVNGDGAVDSADASIVAAAVGQADPLNGPGFRSGPDVNADGVVDFRDLAEVSGSLGIDVDAERARIEEPGAWTIARRTWPGATHSSAGVPDTSRAYFRFYNLLTGQHLYTPSVAERDRLESISDWLREPDLGRIFPEATVYRDMPTKPFYRLYNVVTGRHLWTTDRNEYDTLRFDFPNDWIGEGTSGHLLVDWVEGALPLYRVRYGSGVPRHHWTTDQNEYSTLQGRGWIGEGLFGYLLPPRDPDGGSDLGDPDSDPDPDPGGDPGEDDPVDDASFTINGILFVEASPQDGYPLYDLELTVRNDSSFGVDWYGVTRFEVNGDHVPVLVRFRPEYLSPGESFTETIGIRDGTGGHPGGARGLYSPFGPRFVRLDFETTHYVGSDERTINWEVDRIRIP